MYFIYGPNLSMCTQFWQEFLCKNPTQRTSLEGRGEGQLVLSLVPCVAFQAPTRCKGGNEKGIFVKAR